MPQVNMTSYRKHEWSGGKRKRRKVEAALRTFRGITGKISIAELRRQPPKKKQSRPIQQKASTSAELNIVDGGAGVKCYSNKRKNTNNVAGKLRESERLRKIREAPSAECGASKDEVDATTDYTMEAEEDARSGTSRSQTPPWQETEYLIAPSESQHSDDPLVCRVEQCRFCGEFSKRCLTLTSCMPYVAGDKTTLSLNDINVCLDFNDSLPKTVCQDCDIKLRELSDFVHQVKSAQGSLVNLDDKVQIEFFVKTERELTDGVNDNNDYLESIDRFNANDEPESVKNVASRHHNKKESHNTDPEGFRRLVEPSLEALRSKRVANKKKNHKRLSTKDKTVGSQSGTGLKGLTHKRISDEKDTVNKQKKANAVVRRCESIVFNNDIKGEACDTNSGINKEVYSLFNDAMSDDEFESAGYIFIKTVEDGTLVVT